MDLKEVSRLAKERMKGTCRACAICDGRACAGEVPGMGGLGTGAAFKANVQALAKCRLKMRVVHNVKHPDTKSELFGLPLTMPIMAAPIGGISFNMGGYLTEEEYDLAVARACKSVGALYCGGDGVPPDILDNALKAIKDVGQGIVFIKPWDGEELPRKMKMAADNGCKIMGMDIDAAGLVTLAKMGRPVTPKTEKELENIVKIAHDLGMKFVLKGLMDKNDAIAAIHAGCDAIYVSNHGGRVLDHTPGVAEVLPQIAKVVAGCLPIFVDGGVRDGFDVLKMLALGANFVLIGRPISKMVIGGGEEGVKAYLEQLHTQLIQGMVLTGCQNLDSIDQRIFQGDCCA